MKTFLPIIVLATVAGTAHADSGLRPGLWEMRIIKSVVNGRDTSDQMAGLNAKMNEQMARMSPEQREQMGAMMKQHGMAMPTGDGGGFRICISPEMAKRDVPVVDKNGACQPSNVQRSGNHMSYELSCVSNGTKMTGKGEANFSGDSVSTRSDITTVKHGQTHRMQSETEMKFLKSDCGDVKPIGDAQHAGAMKHP